MAKADGYFPFELESEPAALGLAPRISVSPFGDLHYVRTARPDAGQRHVTLFLHGVANDWTTWTALLRQASSEDRDLGEVILVDLPGFGASSNNLSALDSKEVGRALLRILEECGYTSCRLVGHSMGGFLALDMAAGVGKDRIRSVHLVAGAYFSVIDTVQSPLWSLLRAKKVAIAYWLQSVLAALGSPGLGAVRLGNRVGALPLLLRGFLSHPWRARKSFLNAIADGMRPESFIFAAHNGVDYDPDQEWGRISCPIFAVFGADDKLVPPTDMVRLRTVQGKVKATLIPDAAHFPHVERPRETLSSLFEWPPR